MNWTFTRKLLIGWLICSAVSFLFLSTIFSSAILRDCLNEKETHLYAVCTQLASRISAIYSTDETISTDSFYECSEYMHGLSQVEEFELWLIDAEGSIFASSMSSYPDTISFHPEGPQPYLLGTFNEYFGEETLTVYSAFLSSDSPDIAGYILLHYPYQLVKEQRKHCMEFHYLLWSIYEVLAALLLIIFSYLHEKRFSPLIQAVHEYANGNYQFTPVIHRDQQAYLIADTMAEMAHRIQYMGQEQRQFLANISHDFRSPLTSIKGYLEAIMDGTIPPENQNKYLQIILNETGRLTKLTEGILTLNTFELNAIKLNYTAFDFHTVIRNCLSTFEVTCLGRDISFELFLEGRELMVWADQERIQQVLYNLIDNAVKFSYDHSSIFIRTKSEAGKCRVSIQDYGIGIPKESQDKVWNRFYKVDLSRGKDKQGTGLGLTIIRDIILAHGETIHLISTEGKGTEFVFTLALPPKNSSRKGS